MSNTSIGWIGLGKMGIPMAQQLIKTGYPLAVYNRNPDKTVSLRAQGATQTGSPRELMDTADIIVIMVSDDEATRDMITGPQGLLTPGSTPDPAAINGNRSSIENNGNRGKIIVNMSTVSPALSLDMAAACSLQGHHYIDAPVSGSVRQAEEGQLVIMAGGDESILEELKPVFSRLGRMTLRVGDAGAGNTAKLVINTLLGIYALGLAEALHLAQKNDITTETLMTLVNNSALANAFGKIKGDAVQHDNYSPAFALKHIVKDLGLAKQIGLDSPLGNQAYDSFTAAAPTLGEEDIIAIIKAL